MSATAAVLSGTIHPSSGPISGGYYMAIFLDKQEPWPPKFHNGQRVFVSTVRPVRPSGGDAPA